MRQLASYSFYGTREEELAEGDSLALLLCKSLAPYCPRHPEESVLYGIMAGHLETYLARQRERGRTVPRFVERELRSFLNCGIPAHGFLGIREAAQRAPSAFRALSASGDRLGSACLSRR